METTKAILVLFLVCSLKVFVSPASGYLFSAKVRACENKKMTLTCPPRTEMKISRADYGRSTGREICPHPMIQTTNCVKSVLYFVGPKCNGQNICSLRNTNKEFGDPCPNTYKYLEVDYTCDVRFVRACEHEQFIIICPAGRKILISRAEYGRSAGKEICPHPAIRTTSCVKDVSGTVGHSCNGKNMCTVTSSNKLFGDPCPNTYKYTEVDYTCEF